MTEDQKYQGALYKNNKNKKVRLNPPYNAKEEQQQQHHNNNNNSNSNNNNSNNNSIQASTLTSTTTNARIPATPSAARNAATPATADNMAAAIQYQHPHVSHAAYVEDVPEELEAYLIADDDDNASRSEDDDHPPRAPTPPPVAEGPVNVFDFLVANATPNVSSTDLPHMAGGPVKLSDSTQIVRYDQDANDYLDPSDFSMEANAKHQMIQYGTGPVPVDAPFQTPAPGSRGEPRRKKDSPSDRDVKKDKKRKRLYLDVSDQVMTDAPPVLHSGLTGGLSRLTTKHAVLPPSPQSAETPASPLKKTRHVKHAKSSRSDSVLFSLLGAGSKPKSKKRKHRSASPSSKKTHSHRHRHHRHRTDGDRETDTAAVEQKLLEFSSDKKEGDDNSHGAVIVYKPRADLFLSFVDKGPESERGCSMNKALKRFHRERTSTGTALGKSTEEKELFRSLRLRKNDRGEIVLFCV
ncbi:hypothetical protein SPI_05037 [Niveomyces insectorum RCEF 264]|uniref:Uncharacterized protein n=1 Tax=Niveomyces insectorum RCEF 264 TaxID=1081102 RepID=A0A167TW55_9HYPO|nr:hypothetical protein SPI_05037 [Niveomyces insectorum RCEF 264]